ncbi:MAG: hypothetical protein ACYC6N_24500 [Pirellulaceae bacterium]
MRRDVLKQLLCRPFQGDGFRAKRDQGLRASLRDALTLANDGRPVRGVLEAMRRSSIDASFAGTCLSLSR